MTTRKNILILAHNYGVQFIEICNQYVKLFDPNKYKVTIAYLSGKPSDEIKARTFSEEVIFLNFTKKEIRGAKIGAIKKVLTLCQERKFSMVICHRYKPIYVMMWVAQFCKIPVLFFVMHAMGTLNYLSRQLLVAALVRPNMYFAGVSNAVRDDLREHIWRMPDERVITLYNCIDIKSTESTLFSSEDAKHYFNLPLDSFIFGTTGRLAREKDQKNIIKAFASIKSQCPKAKLLIIGGGLLEQDLKIQTQQLDLNDDIIFAGYVPEAHRYFKAFDTFILASTKEAFGLVLIEAMVARVPVIGTRTNGIPEVIQDAGSIVEPRDSDLLGEAMLKNYALSADKFVLMQEKVYRHVKNNFSIERFNAIFWRIPALRELL
ncbi:MAG: glycosyltransferase [Gammaproteobacteria bacterium]